jgi:hypothetical protein
LTLSDAFFSFLYISLSDYIYPTGHFGFCIFPKFFFVVSFYFYFNDRLWQIAAAYIWTGLINYLQGIVAEELLADCYHEEIVEFWTLDFFSLMYLDLPYIARKS